MKPDSRPEKIPEMDLCDQTGEELVRRWKLGDERAAGILMERHSLRLIALVAGSLNRRFRNSVDPEDIVQSAMGSFFNAVRQSKLKFSGSISLWRLLATFARRKMARTIERLSATKRGGDLVRVPMDEIGDFLNGAGSLRQSESAEGFLDGHVAELPGELREILERLLAGFTQLEIAESLGVDERTVRRRVVHLTVGLTLSANGSTVKHSSNGVRNHRNNLSSTFGRFANRLPPSTRPTSFTAKSIMEIRSLLDASVK